MPKAIFFDLDGTLTDPKPGITGSIRHALMQMGKAAPAPEELHWCIGPPLRQSFVRLVGEADADRALSLYRERFSDVGLYENAPYPGVPELLKALSGKRVFLATSKPSVYAKRILAHFEIAGFFEQVFGSELDGRLTDKSELLAHALAETGIAASHAVMIGDRSHDMIGARNNDMARLGVLYGYGGVQELRDAGAQKLFHTVDELRQNLTR